MLSRPEYSLLYGLIAYWQLWEPSGVARRDSHKNGYAMSQYGTVANRLGRVNRGVDITTSANNHLRYADASDAFRGAVGQSFTVACWVLFDALPSGGQPYAYPVSRWSSTGDWTLIVDAAGAAYFDCNTISGAQIIATPAGTIVLNRWHLLIGWFDPSASANGTINVQVDIGAVYTGALSAAKTSSAGSYVSIGDLGSTDVAYGTMDGGVDECGCWRRVLTAKERRALWNDGKGISYPFYSQRREWYYSSVAGFQAAWAARNNQYIGPGA